jgi:hypothetical protein
MKKHFASILTAGAILLSGHAAWAACSVGNITGKWFFTIGSAPDRSYWEHWDADGCSVLTIKAGPTSNTLALKSVCPAGPAAPVGAYGFTRSGSLTLQPQGCRITGYIETESDSPPSHPHYNSVVNIDSGVFQDPQGKNKSIGGQMVGFTLQNAHGWQKVGTTTLWLMR